MIPAGDAIRGGTGSHARSGSGDPIAELATNARGLSGCVASMRISTLGGVGGAAMITQLASAAFVATPTPQSRPFVPWRRATRNKGPAWMDGKLVAVPDPCVIN